MTVFKYDASAKAEYVKFPHDEPLEIEVDDVWETSKGEGFTLLCQVLTGSQAGKLTKMGFKFQLPSGSPNPGTLGFLKQFFTSENLREGMVLKQLLDQRFSCVSKVRIVNGKEFQNFAYWKRIATEGGY